MSGQVTANLYSQGFGSVPSGTLINAVIYPIDPTSTNIIGPNGPFHVGQRWINNISNNSWTLTSLATLAGATTATWTQDGAGTGALNELTGNTGTATPSGGAIAVVGTGDVSTSASGSTVTISVSGGSTVISTLTGDSGGAIGPSSGNVTLAGTAHQVTTVGSGNTITYSLIGPYTPATYTAHGVLVGEGTSSIVATAVGSNGQVLLGATGADPAFGTLTSSTGITFTGGANSLAINTTGGGLAANPISGTSATGATQSSYICANASQTTVSLPTVAAIGDFFLICGTSANSAGWKVSQATGQEIFSGSNHTTSGSTGNIATGAANTSAWLMCTVANTTWILLAGVGTITYT